MPAAYRPLRPDLATRHENYPRLPASVFWPRGTRSYFTLSRAWRIGIPYLNC